MASLLSSSKQALKGFDIFAAKREKAQFASTWLSILGTFAACGLLLALTIVQLISYSRRDNKMSPSTLPRNFSATMPVPPFSIMIYTDNKPFYNESYFRWSFAYRCVFYGNSKQDDPQYVSQTHLIPAKTCEMYYDLDADSERKIYDEAPTSGGKPALMGCPDWDAADAKLRQLAADGTFQMRPGGHLQGKYGEPSYWWIQATLEQCVRYGAEEGIPCASDEEMAELFSTSMTVDFVTLDQITPTALTWGNIYSNLDLSFWTGYEVFYRPINFIESHKDLPSLYSPTKQSFSKLDNFALRQQARSTTFVTYYVRMGQLVDEFTVEYFSLEDALTKIGAWERILWMIIGTLCIYFNVMYGFQDMHDHHHHQNNSLAEADKKLSASSMGGIDVQTALDIQLSSGVRHSGVHPPSWQNTSSSQLKKAHPSAQRRHTSGSIVHEYMNITPNSPSAQWSRQLPTMPVSTGGRGIEQSVALTKVITPHHIVRGLAVDETGLPPRKGSTSVQHYADGVRDNQYRDSDIRGGCPKDHRPKDDGRTLRRSSDGRHDRPRTHNQHNQYDQYRHRAEDDHCHRRASDQDQYRRRKDEVRHDRSRTFQDDDALQPDRLAADATLDMPQSGSKRSLESMLRQPAKENPREVVEAWRAGIPR